MNKIGMIVGAFLLLASPLWAQKEAKDLTPEELYQIADSALRLVGNKAWHLDFDKTENRLVAYQPIRVESIRQGDQQRDIVQWSNGKTTEAWWLGGDVFAQSPIAEGFIYGQNRWPQDRIGIAAWVSKDNLKGLTEVDGKKAILFEAHLPLKQQAPGFFATDTGPEAGPGLTLAAYVLLEEPRLAKITIDGAPVIVTWVPASTALPSIPVGFARQKAKFDQRRGKLVAPNQSR